MIILKGDCIEVIGAIKPNSMDAIVTDPPYNLHFMGKNWDKDLLHEKWLTEAYRVLKPGGSMLVMGGTRTFHRLMVAIEDTGFIIKDTLMWIYGSGFPKAQDLGKMIDKRMGKEREIIGIKKHSDNFDNAKANKAGYLADPANRNNEKCFGYGKEEITTPATDLAKHWDGFKVGGIKPAYEPIVWAVKPPEGSYIDNVLKWGVGAVNVDECRVGTEERQNPQAGFIRRGRTDEEVFMGIDKNKPNETLSLTKGRFPANVILDEEAGRMLDEQSGELKSGWTNKDKSGPTPFVASKIVGGQHFNDSGGASRFFYCAKASRGERNRGLGDLKDIPYSEYRDKFDSTDSWVSKYPDGKERPMNQIKNNHPTVKPIALFEYLIKLVTREGQIVLDPFLGSGTTAIAAHKVGRECVGIEREDEYVEIAKKRIEHWESRPQQQELMKHNT